MLGGLYSLGAIALITPSFAFGEIEASTPYTLDLTHAKEAPKKAKWSQPDHFNITPDGLGWGTAADKGSRDFWLETEPVGIGLSWRPTSIATIRATVDQPGRSGMLYARYSADCKHWTTWQLIDELGQAKEGAKTQEFHGTLRVPYREREEYDKLRMDYARRDDVPWRSDEEALAVEILKARAEIFRADHAIYRVRSVSV